MVETNDFSLFSSPFDLSASLGSGSSTGGSDDSGSERGEASSPPKLRAASSGGKAPYVTVTTRKSGPVPPRAGGPSLNIDEQISRHNHPISIPIKSHLKPHVNHSQSRIGATTSRGVSPQVGHYSSPLDRPHSFPAAGWHPRGGHRLHHHGLPVPQRSATGGEEYSIMITSPATSSRSRDLSVCGDDDSLINGMHRMSMHGIHDEPRVVDISPASGYYEARKPRLRNGGLNARLYNAFRVTTKDHLSINTRSPSLRGARGANSFSSDVPMSVGGSPYAAAARAGAGSPFAGGWDTSHGHGGPPNFTLGGATNRSFDTSYGSSLSFVSGNASFNHPNSPGPHADNSCDAHIARAVGNSAPNTPGLPPPFSMPGTPLSSASLPPGADIRDVMAIHGAAAAAAADGMMAPLSPTPPFGIKYKTELCLNWINTGTCVYGNKCHFGHGDTDLRARKRVRNFKTQMCCDPAREGARRCMFNARCNFLHPSEPLRRAEPVPYFDEDYVGMLMRDFPGNDYPFGIYV